MFQRILIIAFLCCPTFTLFSQKILKIEGIEESNEAIRQLIEVYVDTSNSLDIDQLLKEHRNGSFIKRSDLDAPLFSFITYWLYIPLSQKDIARSNLGLAIPRQDHIVEIYFISGNNIEKRNSGFFVNGNENDEIFPVSNIIALPELGNWDLFVRIENINDELPRLNLDLVDLKSATKKSIALLIFDAFIIGMMFLMIFYGLFLYYHFKERLYIYYVTYVILLIFWYLGCFSFGYQIMYWLPRKIYPYSDIPIHLGYLFYLLFISKFLNLSNTLPRWDRILKILRIGVIVLVVCYPVYMLVTNRIIVGYTILYITTLLFSVIIVVLIVRLFSCKIRFSNIIAIGTSFLIVGLFISSILNVYYDDYTFIYQKIGTVMELLVFTFGISLRYRIIEQEKREFQVQLIGQLEENTNLQEKVNRELAQKVKERTDEIAEKNEQLTQQNEAISQQKDELHSTLEYLKQTQSQLVQTEKMAGIGQLTAGIAHEINNPINYVTTSSNALNNDIKDYHKILDLYAEISEGNVEEKLSEIAQLKEDLGFVEITAETKELLNNIRIGGEKVAEIVKSLRTFSRLDENDLKKVNLQENIEATLTILNNRIGTHIEIKKQFGDNLKIECFPGKLNQVFLNILNNAIDATENGGKITVQTQLVSKTCRISISDNGKGIPEEIQNRIFEPFFTTKDVGKGKGLGLSTAHAIVKEHHGTIEVESQVDNGTTFTIILPVIYSNNPHI